jgi:hypothetical protein
MVSRTMSDEVWRQLDPRVGRLSRRTRRRLLLGAAITTAVAIALAAAAYAGVLVLRIEAPDDSFGSQRGTVFVYGTAIVVIVATWLLVSVADRTPVSRVRVERFAKRHDLTVTTANGDQVIGYLATTRRWRSVGVVIGVALTVVQALPNDQVEVAFLPAFAGWFVGALVAEARITYRHQGPLRRASLVPRAPSRYLAPLHRWLMPITVGLCLATGVGSVTAAATGREVAIDRAALALVGGVAVAVAVQLTQRRALRRPQPVAEPDVIAADDAIRSRSLHVLTASGATLVIYCVLIQLDVLGWQVGWVTVGSILVPLLGWFLGVTWWSVSRQAEPSSAPAT